MDEILTELNLETLAAVFQGEIIVPSVVQSMSNEKIEQLEPGLHDNFFGTVPV